MNYAVYHLSDGSIVSYGVCVSLDQVAGFASDTVGVVECDSHLDPTWTIVDGVPTPPVT